MPGRETRTTASITWDDALGRIAGKLKANDPGRRLLLRQRPLVERGRLPAAALRPVFGTNYVNNCSYYCHQASGVGLAASLGTGTATVSSKTSSSDLFVLIGGNPASNHPRLMRSLMTVRRSGGQVIVINPREGDRPGQLQRAVRRAEPAVRHEIASLYVQPHIGGDLALLTGVAKHVLERGGDDRAFIEHHTEGFAAFQRQVAVD